MKSKKIILTISIVAVLMLLITFRLVSNKKSLEENLKMNSDFSITIPVITDTVRFAKISGGFAVNGSFEPMHEVSILSETQGKIISINVSVGDKVSAGQILASVDYELAKSQLDMAKFNLEKAEKDMQRFEQLSKGDAITAQQYEGAKQVLINSQAACTSAKVQYENSFIKAPFNGIVTKKYIDKGTVLMPGNSVFDVVEINKMKLVAKLTSDEIAKIKENQPVQVSVDQYSGFYYDGKVNAVVVKADQSKRYDVEIEITNRIDKPIKPGMFGTAIFSDNSKDETLVIPRKALNGSIKKPEIFIVQGDSVILKKIEAKTLDDKNILVTSGLKVGDVFVLSGQINLVNGTKVKVIK